MALAPAAPASAQLQSRFDQAIRVADLKGTTIAYYVRDLGSSEVLAEQHADRLMIPASNMKLFTSASALATLGPKFAFETRLWLKRSRGTAGESKGGSQEGSGEKRGAANAGRSILTDGGQGGDATLAELIVQGGGDPAFADPKVLALTPPEALNGTPYEGMKLDVDLLLRIWVDMVKAKGIKRITRLVMDDRMFDRELVHPSWPNDQLHYWYCAPVSGINFYTNCVDIYAEPAPVAGQTPRIRIVPRSSYYRVQNRASTGGTHTFWASRRIGSSELLLAGKVKQRLFEPIHVTMQDPSIFLGRTLADRLEEAGVKVDAVVPPGADEVLDGGELLHTVKTPLIQVVRRCNKDSQNLYAEALIKRMGRKLTGAAGSWTTGAAAMRIVLQRRLGTKAARVQPVDGSGLSRDNRITARVTVDLLREMHRDKALSRIYRESLAEGGKDGSLRRKYFDPAGMNGKLYGKTGYINGVRTLSGYLVYDRGNGRERVIAFSLLFNDIKPPVYGHHIRELRNKLVRLIDKQMGG